MVPSGNDSVDLLSGSLKLGSITVYECGSQELQAQNLKMTVEWLKAGGLVIEDAGEGHAGLRHLRVESGSGIELRADAKDKTVVVKFKSQQSLNISIPSKQARLTHYQANWRVEPNAGGFVSTAADGLVVFPEFPEAGPVKLARG